MPVSANTQVPEFNVPSRAVLLGMTDNHGALNASTLYDVAESCGISKTAIRLTIRRLAEDGLVETTGRGRKATLQLTDAGLAARAPDIGWMGFAARLDAGLVAWDQQWHLVAFDIPERRRRDRDTLRGHITNMMGAQVTSGLYASAYEWQSWLSPLAREMDLTEHITLATANELVVNGQTKPADIAAHLWPIETMNSEYGRFDQAAQQAVEQIPDSPADALRTAFVFSSWLETILRGDPLLPPPLADPTTPRAARAAYRHLLDALAIHPEVASANVFGSYSAAGDHAVTLNEHDFDLWLLEHAYASHLTDRDGFSSTSPLRLAPASS